MGKVEDKANPDAKTMKVGSCKTGISNEEWNELIRRLDYNFSQITKRADMQRKIVAELIEIQGENEY